MNPSAAYKKMVQAGDLASDEAQLAALVELDRLRSELIQFVPHKPAKGFVSNLRGRWKKPPPPKPVPGVYFWGGVGRGKTFIMDLFYESLPFENKKRIHFHRFMQSVHQELRNRQGEPNPLEGVAETLAGETRVLCLDEFIVTDITDAMILANLLKALFARQVSLVTTSNVEPKHLYKDGLQRALFLPAIDLLYEHTRVRNVDGGVDFRLRVLTSVPLFLSPLNVETAEKFSDEFLALAPGVPEGPVALDIQGREVPAVNVCEDVVWFEFSTLCQTARSTTDYIEIAKRFHAVMISNMPVLTGLEDDAARRFVNLIDELYDRKVKVILSADAPLHEVYQGTQVVFEFDRTRSRLTEMQTAEYLALPHLP